MDAIFPFIFKAALGLMLLYSLYGVLLRRETLYDFNRVVLLLILGLSFALPLLRFTAAPNPLNVHLYAAQEFVAEATPFVWIESAPAENFLTWGQLLTMLYLSGAAIALLIYVYRLVLLALLIASSQKVEERDGVTICLDSKARSPYNWWRWVVMNEDDWRNNAHALLPHELAHARLGHSWDMLFCEIAVRLQWFNPMAWVLREDLRAVHEFQADRAALASGISSKEYQLLLIKKAVSPGLQPAANSLNSSSLKQRLIMMYSHPSKKWAAAKALYLLPLAAVALLGYAQPAVLEKVVAAETTRELALDAPIVQQDKQKKATKALVVTIDQLKGKPQQVKIGGVTLKGEANAIVVNNSNVMKSDSILVIVDGKEMTPEALNTLELTEIANVNVFKGKAMKAVYSDARYERFNSVVEITTKSNPAATTAPAGEKQNFKIVTLKQKDVVKSDDVIVFIDDKEVPADALKTLKSTDIVKMDVIKDTEAVKKIVGDRADKAKLILIMTKAHPDAASVKSNQKTMVFHIEKDNDGTTVLEGVTKK